jgi:LysR family cyn operon transcriptional activator
MELRHLHYFLKIAETSSFTQAAAALHVTQPTLSHQINQLEREIGTPLFDRIGRSIRLTEQGRIFREYAQRALRELETGLTAVSESEALVHGQLKIGVFRSFGNSALPAVLAEFHRAYPGVRISVQQMSLADMESGLIEGALNLAITTYVPPTSGRIVAEEIFTEPLVLAVSTRHPLNGRSAIDLDELAGVPLVLRASGTPSRQLIDECFAARGIVPHVVMEMSSGDATLATVRCSELATICAARALEGATELSAVRISEPRLKRSGAILWHRTRYHSAAASVFAQMVKGAHTAAGTLPAERAAPYNHAAI